jgi:hypothetical protein
MPSVGDALFYSRRRPTETRHLLKSLFPKWAAEATASRDEPRGYLLCRDGK